MASPRAPIVLAPRIGTAAIAEVVAPGLDDLGVMLPTTPLHIEVLRDPEMPPLVMTSGNLTEEPLCRSNRGAVAGLSGIADLFLLHDRDIVRRIDDSVVRTNSHGPMIVRRARGWVPEPVKLPVQSPIPVVATGGHLQVTACVAQGDLAFPSQHVGDLDSVPARTFLREVIDGLLDFLQLEPGLVAVDAHPDYPSTWLGAELATEFGVEVVSIQHHLAHVAAVLAEYGHFPEPGQVRLGIALDGTGWGPDNTAWGGEWILIGGDLIWRRVAHLEALSLVGGEQAVLEPWRVAIAALVSEGAGDLVSGTPMADTVDRERLEAVTRLAEKSVWPKASGAGRVFEAAGALLGVGSVNRWEGEAAARLESLASRSERPGEPWQIDLIDDSSEPVLRSSRLLAEAARRSASGETPESVAADFHATFCAAAAEITNRVALEEGCPVALGGGCMVNRILGSRLGNDLAARGFEALLPHNLPPGDGGLSYGQAVIAAVAAARGEKVRMLDVLSDGAGE